MNIKNTTAFLILVAILGSIFLYFSPKSEGLKLTTIRVGAMPIAHCAILSDVEVFKKYGLNIEMSTAKGGALLSTALIQGGLDITFSNTVTPILAFQNGHSMVSLGPATIETKNHVEHSIVTAANAAINEPKDLEGKTVAVNTLNNIDHLLLLNFFNENNVDAELVSFIEVPFPFMKNSIENESADAIAVVEPFLTIAKESGMKSIGDYFISEDVDRTVVSSFYTTKQWLEENPEVASRFQQALSEVVQKYQEDDVYAQSLVANFTNIEPDTLKLITMPRYIENIEESDIDYLFNTSLEHGFVDLQNKETKEKIFELIR